jgi:hypothetical protein
MFILLAIIEVILLALVVFGDVVLFRAAVRRRRFVYAPAIVLLTVLAAAIGYALLITLAFQACVSQDEPCIS